MGNTTVFSVEKTVDFQPIVGVVFQGNRVIPLEIVIVVDDDVLDTTLIRVVTAHKGNL